MMFNQGDILLVPLPFTDLSSQKRRPVIVLSNREYNDLADDLIVAAVTSVIDQKPNTILLSNYDMIDGVLKVESCIRADKIYTLSQILVIKRFGKVRSEIISKVKERLLALLED